MGDDAGIVTGVLLPALGLTAVVLGAAWLVVPRGTRSHVRLAAGIGAAALAGLVAGAALFGWLYADRVPGLGLRAARAPLAAGLHFLGRSAMASLVWAPILALWWLVAAQGVERRRGEDRMRSGRGVRSRPPPPRGGSR